MPLSCYIYYIGSISIFLNTVKKKIFLFSKPWGAAPRLPAGRQTPQGTRPLTRYFFII